MISEKIPFCTVAPASPFLVGSSLVPVAEPPFTAMVVPRKAMSQSVSLSVTAPVSKLNFVKGPPTGSPCPPVCGADKFEMVSVTKFVNTVILEADNYVKQFADISICPEVAPDGTVVTISVVETEVTVAETPLNESEISEASEGKSVPVILISVPTVPDSGEIDITVNSETESPSSSLQAKKEKITIKKAQNLSVVFMKN